MSFTSLNFLLFFPTVLFSYYLVPWRARGYLLLAASYYFYACWNVYFVALIIFITLTSYFDAIVIEQAKNPSRKKAALIVAVAINVLIIAVFKYYNFFVGETVRLFGHAYGPTDWFYLNILLPLGISFHVFQCIGYHVDVFRGTRKTERNLPAFALFVVFFPQLVAGPIERSTTLLPQLRKLFDRHFSGEPQFDYDNITAGLRLMLFGFAKKLIVADKLALFVDPVFREPAGFTAVDTMIAAAFFGIQIYFDFSGYTDIARGAAQALGFRLMENFNQPYLARSIPDFWHRWHMSLTTWFRDYVYFPMGGNRVSEPRWMLNIMAVFLLSGLWHGANWTYVAWGAIHGVLVIASRKSEPFRSTVRERLWLDRLPLILPLFQVLVVFALATFAWVFFRAQTLNDAITIVSGWGALLTKLLALNFVGVEAMTALTQMPTLIRVQAPLFWLIGLTALAAEIVKYVSSSKQQPIGEVLNFRIAPIRWVFYLATGLFVFLSFDSATRQFIYFQF